MSKSKPIEAQPMPDTMPVSGAPSKPPHQEEGAEMATHLLDWLPSAYDHCRYGSREWCEGYPNNAVSVILSQASEIEALRREREAGLRANEALNSAIDRCRRDASAAETKLAAAIKVIEPFANAVFNDNGDMTVNLSAAQSDDFIRAYFFSRRNFLDANGGGNVG